MKDGGWGEKVVTVFIDQKQSVPRTVTEPSDFDFSSKLSFIPSLPKIVIFILSDTIPGRSLPPAISLPTPKPII